jgi:S1-C subfamily serine protease
MNKKNVVGVILIAFFIGAIGSIVIGRFVIPYFADFKNLSFLNRISSEAPIIINHREEVHLNEGANLIDLSKQAGNYTVGFYRQAPGGGIKFLGNGIIMSNDGLIFTTKQVAASTQGSSPLWAVLNDGTKYQATIRATDPRADLAVVTISANNLSVAPLSDAKALLAGQRILGIGQSNREQFHKFLTGLVTNSMANNADLDRVFSSIAFEETIKTDANISADYFGGPVLNLEGKVVGMMANINNNILPSEDLQTALSSYLSTGKIIRPFIGIKYLSLSNSLAKVYSLPTGGALVNFVEDNSAAKRAGLLSSDLITSVDGIAIDGNNSFEYLFNNHPISQMRLKVLRAGKEMEIIVQPDSNE